MLTEAYTGNTAPAGKWPPWSPEAKIGISASRGVPGELAWPLRKDDTHKSRSVNNFFTTSAGLSRALLRSTGLLWEDIADRLQMRQDRPRGLRGLFAFNNHWQIIPAGAPEAYLQKGVAERLQ